MRKILAALLTILLFTLSGCGNEKDIRKDLESTLNELISQSGSEEVYVYRADIFQEDSGSEITLDNLRSKVTYKIRDIGDSKATVVFTAPDTMALLNAAVQSGVSDTEELMGAVDEALQGDFPTCEYEVELELKEMNEHWYLVPNAQLENALSGGLLDGYSEGVMDYVNRSEETVK